MCTRVSESVSQLVGPARDSPDLGLASTSPPAHGSLNFQILFITPHRLVTLARGRH